MTEEDRRPPPKCRKHGSLWQYFTLYDELIEQRKRHILRSSSAERGKTYCFNPDVEAWFLEQINLEDTMKQVEKLMVEEAKKVGPIYDWLVALNGISPSFAARLLAYIDYPGPIENDADEPCECSAHDPERFRTISKLWRFAGLATVKGKAEVGTQHYNRRLKALLLGPTLIADQFVRQRTIIYRDVYDKEKARLTQLHPDPLCNKCNAFATKKGKSWICPQGCQFKKGEGFKVRYNPAHIDNMARRKMAKVFLSHLWLLWRQDEGLPISKPYILREGTGHSHYIEPPGR